MTDFLKETFKRRLDEALSLVRKYQINYQKIGVFGSYARGDYNGNSDIDIAIIVEEKPSRIISGSLREDCELIGVDIVFITPGYFKEDNSRFATKLRKDWREIHEE